MSSLTRVFVSKEKVINGTVEITGSDASHLLKVMRLGIGDKIEVCDMQRCEYIGEITKTYKDRVIARLSWMKQTDTELPYKITVFQALVKGDKFEQVVQKSVELGAFCIVPVICERCIAKADKKNDKTERYNKIAESAASQCGRGIIPEVETPVSFKEAIRRIKDSDCGFMCYEGDDTVFINDFVSRVKAERKIENISFLVGPEGGISANECDFSRNTGVPLIGLGKRILRTETASLFVLSALNVLI